MLLKIHRLCAAIAAHEQSPADRDEYLKFVEDSLGRLVDYANCVIRQQTVFPSWRFRYDGVDLLERMERSMETRNAIHGAAVASMRALNRHCALNSVDVIFPGIPDGPDDDENVKDAVARLIGYFINEPYNHGIGNDPAWRAFDNAIVGKEVEYDKGRIPDVIRATC